MTPRTQVGSVTRQVGDERIGLMSSPPDILPSTTSIKSAFSTMESVLSLESPIRKTPQLVTWGIHWKQPALMIAFALCGLAGAIGHHVYYRLMNQTPVSSTESQQWALRFGTAFSVFTVTMLRAAVVAAYNQYIWKVFRNKSFSVADIDKVFSLTSDFTGFFSSALFRQEHLVILLAFLSWLLPLAGLMPTATLSVVTALYIDTTDQTLPTLDFKSAYWENSEDLYLYDSRLTKLATVVGVDIGMPQLTVPAPNSSYALQFYGLTVSCENAKSSEQAIFDRFSRSLLVESEVLTLLTFEMFTKSEWELQSVWNYGWLLVSVFEGDDEEQIGTPFFIQTANQNIICSQANASFEVEIDYSNGIQTINQRNVEIMNIVNQTAESFVSGQKEMNELMLGLVVGNLTYYSDIAEMGWGSDVLGNTGLVTCEEIFWWANPDKYNNTIFGPKLAPFTAAELDLPAEYSQCRNRSISLAMQDLANNLTIGLLSISEATVNVSTPVSITTSQIVYQYDSLNLIISYAAGIVATIFAVVVGLVAIHNNGVCHSTSFSAIMRSTIGNREMSELSKGQSLGAEPLSKTVAEKKLRLGVIKDEAGEAEKDEWGDPLDRISFGLEGNVMRLIKGVKSL